jgi:hypothetical protein
MSLQPSAARLRSMDCEAAEKLQAARLRAASSLLASTRRVLTQVRCWERLLAVAAVPGGEGTGWVHVRAFNVSRAGRLGRGW